MEALGISRARVHRRRRLADASRSKCTSTAFPSSACPRPSTTISKAHVITFGFDSAVACATDALDRLHTTAESHNRVMVLEVMGRYAGWIALYAGRRRRRGRDPDSGNPVHLRKHLRAKSSERESQGKHFTLVIVAEGAREKDGGFVTAAGQEANREARLGGIGAVVAAEVEKRTGKETRTCVLGHLQRGGRPTPLTARYARCLEPTRSNSSPPAPLEKWWAGRGPCRGSQHQRRGGPSQDSATGRGAAEHGPGPGHFPG